MYNCTAFLYLYICPCTASEWENMPIGDVSGQIELLVHTNGIRFNMPLSEYTLGGESQENVQDLAVFYVLPYLATSPNITQSDHL